MAVKKQVRFSVTVKKEGEDGTEVEKVVELAVRRPNMTEIQKGQDEFNKICGRAVRNEAPMQFEVEKILRKRGQWDDEKQSEYDKLSKEVDSGETKLKKGGIKLKDGYAVALEVFKAKRKRMSLDAERAVLNQITAEGQAEQARFNYYISTCLVDPETNKPYYASIEDYLADANKGAEPAREAANQFSALQYNIDPDFQLKQTEVAFLVKYGFMNEKMQILEKRGESNGRFLDLEGHVINENGRFINEKNELVDIKGNVITEEGELVISGETTPFLDDDGNAVSE